SRKAISQILICGIKVTNPSTNNIVNNKIEFPLITSSILNFAVLAATNKLTPTGGVINPTAKLNIIIKPKCIGSTPISIANGNKIGVKITIAAKASITKPTISKNKFKSNKIITLLSLIVRTKAATFSATPSSVISLPNILAITIKRIIVEEVTPALERFLYNFFILKSLYTKKPIIIPYEVAIAAASVGVINPP